MNLPIVSSAFISALAVSMSLSGSAHAEAPSFSGEWTHTGGKAEAEQRKKAIETMTKDLNVFVRGKARGKLGEQTAPAKMLKLEVDEESMKLTRDGKAMKLQLGADPIVVKKNGKEGRVTARRKGNTLIVTTAGDNGRRVATYSISPDGQKLYISMTMKSKKLDGALAYKETYSRK